MAKRGWDLSSKSSMDAAAEWMRKGAGALLVLVVRAEDFAFAVDAQIAPADAAAMVECILDPMREQLVAEREAARAQTIINTAKVEIEFFEATGMIEDVQFFDAMNAEERGIRRPQPVPRLPGARSA